MAHMFTKTVALAAAACALFAGVSGCQLSQYLQSIPAFVGDDGTAGDLSADQVLNRDGWVQRAGEHVAEGNFEQAADCYMKAVEIDPNNAELLCDCGYAQLMCGRERAAEARLQEATGLRPDFARAHNNLGVLLAHQGREAGAVTAFRRGGCKDSEAHANVAYLMLWSNRRESAQTHFELALLADPNLEIAEFARRLLPGLERPSPVQQVAAYEAADHHETLRLPPLSR